MKHTSLKIFSLLIAVVLWLYVQSESNTVVRSFIAPVELKGIPEGMIVTSPSSPAAEVTVRGPSFIVNKIPSSPPIFTMTAPTGLTKSYTATLSGANLDLLPRVSVVSIEPGEIKFELERIVSKNLTVRVPKLGSLPTDLSLTEIKLSPESIAALGPESQLANRSFIETEPIDLATISQSQDRNLVLRSPGAKVRLEKEEVTAKISVALVKKERTFETPIKVMVGDTEKEIKSLQAASILVKGPKSIIEALTISDFNVFVDLDRHDSDFKSDLEVKVPENVELVSISPDKLDVTKFITRKGLGSKSQKK